MASARTKILPAARIAAARGALLAAAAFAALWCTETRAQAPRVSAVVVKAKHGCFSSAVRFTGTVVPRAEAIVNLNIEGYEISEVLVAEGDMVTPGQALAKLTRLAGGAPGRPPLPPGAAQAGGPSQPQPPATMMLTAPTGGLVSKSTAKVGAVAAAIPLPPPMGPEPLFRIIVDNQLDIEADIPSVHLPKLSIGQLARVRLQNGRDFTSRVRAILPEIDRKTQLGKVRLTVDNDPAIRAGMFVRGTVEANHSCGVSIPRAAVQYQTEGTTVQVVRDTTVETRRVRLGLFSDTDVEVQDGVKEGELVIANAGGSLHDGDQVKPMFADEADQPRAQ